MQLTEDLKTLFKQVRTQMGAPIRPIQLTDEMLCDLLETVVGDYAAKVQNWIIEYNWLNFNGQKVNWMTNPQELAMSLTQKQLDFSRNFAEWFSRDVGLSQRGPWELKKDFFKIEKGKQCYVIPAGREINRVLYITPSTTKAALFGTMGCLDGGIGGGFSQLGNMGFMNGMGGMTGFYVGSAYDTCLLSADLKYKNSLFRGDLAYKVTAGPEGTHIVHLLSTPGSPNTMGGIAVDDTWRWNKYCGCYCWYTYYDTNGLSDGEIDECRIANAGDMIITPDMVPLDKMRYELMNNPTQQTIRQLLTAKAFMTLAFIRGTFQGKVTIPQAELNMDYQMFLEQGKTLEQQTMDDLKTRLENMLPWNLMKNQADMTDSLLKIMQSKPLPTTLMWR